MITTTETIEDIKKANRWLIVMGRAFEVNETDKVISLDRFDLAYSLGRLRAWADKPVHGGKRNPGKFYLPDLTRKQKEVCEQYLDARFVTVG